MCLFLKNPADRRNSKLRLRPWCPMQYQLYRRALLIRGFYRENWGEHYLTVERPEKGG